MAPAGRRRRARITAEDLAQYGSVAGGTVNVERAARGLGVSTREVRQAIRQAEAAQSNMFYRRMSRRGDADVAEGASVPGMLQAAYGRGPRGGAVNARAPRRISVCRPARFVVGRLELSDRRRLTSKRCSQRRGARPPPNADVEPPPRISGPAHAVVKRCAPATSCGSVAPKVRVTTPATAK